METRRRLPLLVCGAMLLAPVDAAVDGSERQTWRYTDERGGVHFTDNHAGVPERYLDVVELVEIQEAVPNPNLEESTADGDTEESPEASVAPADSVTRRLVRIAEQNAPTPEALATIEQLEGWLNTWGVAYVLSGIPWAIVSFASGFHALRRRRFLWALGHGLAWPIVIPIYLLTCFDSVPKGARVAMLVVWTAPFVVGGLAMRAFWLQIAGGSTG